VTSRTILDLDLRKVLSRIEQRYRVKLPRSVLAVDYGDRGDLYIRFKHIEKPLGEPVDDGLAIFFYQDHHKQAVAVEILDLNALMQD
jgi:hypothetical protein